MTNQLSPHDSKRDFVSIADWTGMELMEIIDLSTRIKEYPADFTDVLRKKQIALIFDKPSLRTHVTFDVGIAQLGGHSVYLNQQGIHLGERESVYDVAKNLERWVDAVVIRTYAHQTCLDFTRFMDKPVINALDDVEHPCQAVGDFLTIREKLGTFHRKKMVFVGDGNNVCHSLMLLASKVGMDFIASTPRGYEPDQQIFKIASHAAKESDCTVDIVHNPREAVRHADIVYTDVWASMGREFEKDERAEKFKAHQVNAKLMSLAKHSAFFMHCLPAHRGEEVTDDVMDSQQSIIFDQAENRLHSQKAILFMLLKGD
jgi:ornithine carbamoyltransferase